MDKNWDHLKYEQEIYRKWEPHFAPKKGASLGVKPFTILMPPPNANASLHAGHAMYTIDDIMARWKRMQGYAVEWIPGRDHAGFETQFVYEKNLAKEGKSRMDFDRETLYNNVYKFVDENSGLIFNQFKRLGFSADWEKSVFTLDKQVLERVFETFKKMEKEGLVYRDEYIVNYCTHCGTSLAELEVEHEERIDPLYYIKYGPFVLATVRPETKFGDSAVAVHPKDKRYTKYIGQEVEVVGLLGKFKIKVIADDVVDMSFGTGVVKVTPAHDPNDFEMGKRHQLEIKRVIELDGRLNEKAGPYKGLKVIEARKRVVEDMEKAGLIEKIDEKYVHNVIVCYKCKHVLEPMVVPNWFIKVAELKKPVIDAVIKNKIKFFPARFKKQMLDWLKIMHDWPISRQIVWGIRIPVWYDINKNKEISVSFVDKNGTKKSGNIHEVLKGCPIEEVEKGLQSVTADRTSKYVVSVEKPGESFLPETDTFDTWFSSGQWPLVTGVKLPTDFMGTLADILKFWVSRMIMFSLYLKKEIPFKTVYLWSMVADAKGVKMSKSKGNVINPITLVDKYGADALRMTLIYGVAPGGITPLSEDKVRGMRNFANKIWNAGRYVKEMEEKEIKTNKVFDMKLKKIIKNVTANMDKYRFGMVAETLYEEFWHWYCDKQIELSKTGVVGRKQLMSGLEAFLKLLHPFMPFVTEVVWGEIREFRKKPNQMLVESSWPEGKHQSDE